MEIFKTPIEDRKEFNRIDYHYEQVEEFGNHIYLYKLTPPKRYKRKLPYKQYELVRGKKSKQPDGTIVYIYPGDEDFGTYGYYICGTEESCRKQIMKYVNKLNNVGI